MAHSADLLSQIAAILGREADARRYGRLQQQTRAAFSNRYLTPDGLIVGQTQTALVLALQFNLVPDDLRPVMVQNLVRDIMEREMHLSTGFVGTPYINHVLTQNGRTDIAFQLLQQKHIPHGSTPSPMVPPPFGNAGMAGQQRTAFKTPA